MADAPLPRGKAIEAAEGAPLPRGNVKPAGGVPIAAKKRALAEKDDVLFGIKEKKSKRNKISADANKKKIDELNVQRELEERKTSSVMTFSRLSVGLRLLGCVKSVTNEKAVVGFVNGLVATLVPSDVSDEHAQAIERGEEPESPLTSILSVGQFIRCVVTHVEHGKGSERILRISCKASIMNKPGALDPTFAKLGNVVVGTIKSIEDHGVIVNLGVKHVTGFLPFAAVPGGKKVISAIGKQVECFVTAKPSKNVVNLKLTDSDFLSTQEATSLLTLQPGALIDAKVVRSDLFDGGALFSFFSGLLHGTADWLHRGRLYLEEKTRIQVRVIWVDPGAKTVGLSAMEHLVSRKENRNVAYSIGDIIEDVPIEATQPHIGVLVRLLATGDAANEEVFGFAHLGRLVDSKDLPDASVVKKQFAPGTKVKCRVIDVNPLDGTLAVSLQKSVLEAAVTTYDSLHPGDVVKGTVIKVDPAFGVLLELGKNVKGIVTFVHLSDSATPETAPETRYKVGQVCKGRVLTREGERVAITLKKTLVQLSNPLVSYEDAKPGSIVQGFVTKVDDYGIIVTFFGGVHGIVPAFTLGSTVGKDSEQLYRIGQVVKVKIISVVPEKQRLRLSFNLAEEPKKPKKETSSGASSTEEKLEVGTLVPQAVIKKKTDDGLSVEFKIEDGTLCSGFVPKLHLSDLVLQAEHVFGSLQQGGKLKNLRIVRQKTTQESESMALLSLKTAIDCEKPDALEDVDVDAVYTGYVSNITEFGVFVAFGKGLTAFVPHANIWDGFHGKPSDYFAVNQTVKVSVTAVDAEKKRITGSLKPSVVGSSSTSVLSMLLDERAKFFRSNKALSSITLGSAVKGRVSHRVEGAGVGVEIGDEGDESGLIGFCSLEHCPNHQLPKIGSELSFRVLDVDMSSTASKKAVIDLSARKSLEHARWRSSDSSFESMEFDAEVELGKREYCIVSYIKSKSVEKKGGKRQKTEVTDSASPNEWRELAICSLVDWNNLYKPPTQLKPGTKCRVRVPVTGPSTILEFVSTNAAPSDGRANARPRARSGSLSEFLGPRVELEIGAIINAKIRDIRGCWARFDVRQTGAKSVKVVMHSTDVIDPPKSFQLTDDYPSVFAGQSVGDVIRARVVEKKGQFVYLSMKPSILDAPDLSLLDTEPDWEKNPPEVGKTYNAYVDENADDGLWIGLSRKVRGFCHCTDVTTNLERLDELFNQGQAPSVFPVGRPVKVQVVDVDVDKKRLGLKLVWDAE